MHCLPPLLKLAVLVVLSLSTAQATGWTYSSTDTGPGRLTIYDDSSVPDRSTRTGEVLSFGVEVWPQTSGEYAWTLNRVLVGNANPLLDVYEQVILSGAGLAHLPLYEHGQTRYQRVNISADGPSRFDISVQVRNFTHSDLARWRDQPGNSLNALINSASVLVTGWLSLESLDDAGMGSGLHFRLVHNLTLASDSAAVAAAPAASQKAPVTRILAGLGVVAALLVLANLALFGLVFVRAARLRRTLLRERTIVPKGLVEPGESPTPRSRRLF